MIKQILHYVLLASLTGVSDCGKAGQQASSPSISLIPTDLSKANCIFNKVLQSSGGPVSFWRSSKIDPLAPAISGESNLVVAVPNDRGFTFLNLPTPVPVEPLVWSSDSSLLYVRYGEDQVGKIDVDTAVMTFVGKIPTNLNHVNISVGNEADLAALLSNPKPSILNMFKRSQNAVREWILVHGSNASYAYIDGETLRFRGDVTVNAFAPTARNPMFVKNRKGIEQLVFDSWSHEGTHSSPFRSIRSEDTLTIKDRVRLRTSDNGQELSPAYGAKFINASSSGVYVSSLYLSVKGQINLRLQKSGGSYLRDKPVCREMIKQSAGNAPEIKLSAIGLVSDTGSNEVIETGLLYQLNSREKTPDLVIQFGGGPALPLDDDILPNLTKDLLGQGVSVLRVEYPGSSDRESDRQAFSMAPANSLTSGAHSIDQWIRSNRRRFRHIIVVGESFGAIEARLLQNLRPIGVRRYIYVAPLVRLKDPKEWAAGPNVISVDRQLIFENNVFGGAIGRRAFASDLVEIWAYPSAGVNDDFFFALNDAKSDVRDLSIRVGSASVLRNVSHGNISSSPDVLSMILSYTK